MNPRAVFAGFLQREYLLFPSASPRLDKAGGAPLYAAAGWRVWEEDAAILSRVGEDYPRVWFREFESVGIDVRGIQIAEGALDIRYFRAYDENFDFMEKNPVSHFARYGLPFPKTLLAYTPPSERAQGWADSVSPRLAEIPKEYLDARAVHFCPMSPAVQMRLLAAFKRGTTTTFTLDASPALMTPESMHIVRALLDGLTAFIPSEEELRALFREKTRDIWEMTEELAAMGCEIIVVKRGKNGQMLYDALGKKRWELPPYDSRIVDPTGAGDAFCGGFLAGYLREFDPLQAPLYGNVSASLSVEGSGAFYPLDAHPALAEARLHAIREMVRRV